jgi:hypothetical protein
MNTTLKGDIFEKRVFDLINDLLKNDEYYLSGKNSKIFAKKKAPMEEKIHPTILIPPKLAKVEGIIKTPAPIIFPRTKEVLVQSPSFCCFSMP